MTGTESNRMVATYFVNGGIEEMTAHGFESHGEFAEYIKQQIPTAKDIAVTTGGPMEWVLVSENLPEMQDYDGWALRSDNVLAVDRHGQQFTGYFFDMEIDKDETPDPHFVQFGRDGYKYELADITHWMPLPNKPTAG